jgi:hypothetical protein
MAPRLLACLAARAALALAGRALARLEAHLEAPAQTPPTRRPWAAEGA